MSSKPLVKIRALLNSNSLVKGLLSEAAQQHALLRQISELLPDSVRHHCKAALMDENLLLIYADSSAWASRLRYFSRSLKSELRKQGVAVTKITVRVMLENPLLKRSQRLNVPAMSPANAELIQQTATAIADPKLSAALHRLGKHGHQKA